MACTPPTEACRALTEAAEQARALDNTTFLLNADSEPSGVAGVAAALGENP